MPIGFLFYLAAAVIIAFNYFIRIRKFVRRERALINLSINREISLVKAIGESMESLEAALELDVKITPTVIVNGNDFEIFYRIEGKEICI